MSVTVSGGGGRRTGIKDQTDNRNLSVTTMIETIEALTLFLYLLPGVVGFFVYDTRGQSRYIVVDPQ